MKLRRGMPGFVAYVGVSCWKYGFFAELSRRVGAHVTVHESGRVSAEAACAGPSLGMGGLLGGVQA